jgi:hypothetical protein
VRGEQEDFFFEKKKQKTFARLVPRTLDHAHVTRQQRRSKSFLLLFFKKEVLSKFFARRENGGLKPTLRVARR